jgi:hypothetical protein
MENENLGEELLEACLSDLEQAEWLISRCNGDQNILNWQDLKCQNSILHLIVYQNLHQSAEILLTSGADPNIANKVFVFFPSLLTFLSLRTARHLSIGSDTPPLALPS